MASCANTEQKIREKLARAKTSAQQRHLQKLLFNVILEQKKLQKNVSSDSAKGQTSL
jgi:hypothetical protein